MTTPNTEQLTAVTDYALAVGPDWKSSLSSDWMRAGTTVYELRDRYHLLQQVRNQHGPKWLATFEVDLAPALAQDAANHVRYSTSPYYSKADVKKSLRDYRKKWGKEAFDAALSDQYLGN
jgi:hypothetical protein